MIRYKYKDICKSNRGFNDYMNKTKIVMIECILLAVNIVACGKTEVEQTPTFPLTQERVTQEEVPAELPDSIEDYDTWTRETPWCKIAESDDAAIYANADDNTSLYVEWNHAFTKCNWENGRDLESDITMKEQDIDRDGEKELLVVLHNVTGSGTGEDELHVLETKNKSGFEAYHVPMDSFWNWVKTVAHANKTKADIADCLLYTMDLTEEGITVWADIYDTDMQELGNITVDFVWNEKSLQVTQYTYKM